MDGVGENTEMIREEQLMGKLMVSHGEVFETGCVFKVDVLTQLIDKSLPMREEQNRSRVFEQEQDGASFQH